MKPGVHIHGEPGAMLDGSQAGGAVVSCIQWHERTAVLSGFVIAVVGKRGSPESGSPTLRNNVIIEHAGRAFTVPSFTTCAQQCSGGKCWWGYRLSISRTEPVITYNAFWQNQPADVLGCPSGIGNLYAEPGFVDPSQGNYRLRP